MNQHAATRLNKFISESGLCSRREADRYIEKGNVFINGKRAKIGDQVFPGDRVMVNGHNIEPKEESNFVLLAFNKPVGITSTTESSVRDNIVDYVNYSERIFPIGRLDKDSSGLIFLTNNGDIVNKILRAGNKHEKEYVVTVNKPITEDFIFGMSNGVPILGVNTRKCKVRQISTFVFNIILIQGLNRQIRRMCEHFGYEVTKLERTRIMNINLKGIATGEFRELTEEEMEVVMKSVEKSSSDVAQKPKNTKKKTTWDEDSELQPAPAKKPGKASSRLRNREEKNNPLHLQAKPIIKTSRQVEPHDRQKANRLVKQIRGKGEDSMVDGLIHINTSLFAALSVLHVYWAFGGKWGSKSSIPTKRGTNHPLFEARIVGTLIIGVGLLLFAAVSMANMLMADSKTINVLTYCIAIIFFIRTVGDFKYVGFFKKVKGTGFANADTKFYVPLCAYISISSFYIAAF